MSPPEYLNAVVPKPHTALGMRLRPLSIGHILLMQWQGLSYVQEKPGRATMDDLISACLICSMRFSEYQEFLRRDDLEDELKRRGRGFQIGDLGMKHRIFDEYLTEGTESPEVEIPDEVSSSLLSGSPWLQCLRVCLMAKLHVASAETFDYPYRLALWDCFGLRESEGKLHIVGSDESDEQADTISALRELNLYYIEQLAGVPKPGVEAPREGTRPTEGGGHGS